MKIFGLLVLLLVAVVVADDSSSSSSEDSAEIKVLPLAQPCDQEACQLPDCRCSSTNIPGGLAPRDTPQFVMLTFDDAVNVQNIHTYRDIIYGRRNHNGCPVGATFYVSHEYTNYQLVNELYNQGLEIALHSISHQNNQSYWAAATYEDMAKEFGEQRRMASHFANIPYDEIKGIRIPFLQMTGNASFEVMKNYGLTYDASWPTTAFINPGLWPYTLDHATIQDCIIPPCPTASIPGVWINPMISWEDLNGNFCSMADSCYWTPNLNDEDGWFQLIMSNFERHYLGNRAPFGFYVHEWYIATNVAVKNALVRFLDVINNVNDVFLVNSAEVVEWTKNPKKLAEYNSQGCRQFTPTTCQPATCPLESDHGWYPQTFWLAICNVCPRVYPWLGNALGV